MDNLWPEDIGQTNDETMPFKILQEQAELLGTRTQNIITASVETEIVGNISEPFTHDFYIVAPSLQNYRFRLFTVAHGFDLYPVKIFLIDGMAQSDDMFGQYPILHTNFGLKSFVEIETEQDFLNVLKLVFSSTKTQKVVRNLLAQSKQSRGYTSPNDDLPF
jgi:hypothetical protein